MPTDNPNEFGSETDVVIIGCGPVGALLANLLGLQGIATVVLEREAAAYSLPRAVQFDDEVMRLLQTVGLAESMQPLVHVVPGMKFVDDSGRLLLDWQRPVEVGPQGWHRSYRFHQPDLERILRDGFARWPTLSFYSRSEVYAIDETPDAVLVRYEDLTNGRLNLCRARYVVGCDGARSLVRRLIGQPMEDLGFHERWLVVDTILRRPRPDLGDYSVQHCNSSRPATYVRGTGNRRRWEIAVLPDEVGDVITRPANVFQLLKPWLSPEDADLERAALYIFHSAIALKWRRARLMIAGDAAHLTPPFLGQGMCAGIRDAGNLAWKLARVLRGKNDDSVLDTYQAERSPHVREYIDLAVRLGGLINAKSIGSVVADAGPDGGVAKMTSIKPRLGAGLSAGWGGIAGEIAPQPHLQNGIRLDDHVGYEFAAILRPDFAAALPIDVRAHLDERGIVTVVADARETAAWLQDIEAPAVLVRPDRYVLGAAHTLVELQALMALV